MVMGSKLHEDVPMYCIRNPSNAIIDKIFDAKEKLKIEERELTKIEFN